MKTEFWSDSQLTGSQEEVGTEMIVKDGDGVETGRRSLTSEELARFQAEGQPTPDETLVVDINAAANLDDMKAALVKRFGG